MKKAIFCISTLLMIISISFLSACSIPPETTDTTTETNTITETNSNTNAPTEAPTEATTTEEVVDLDSLSKKYDSITFDKAIELSGTTKGEHSTEKYYVCGMIKDIVNGEYGNFTITDGTNELYIFGSFSADGTVGYKSLENKPVAGDLVVLYGVLGFYNDAEMKDAWIIEYYHPTPVVDDTYTAKSILEARNSAEGDKVILEGVVAQITYATGLVPDGFILVDDTSSIYVYGRNTASQVEVGSTVKIAGTKTYYILDTEIVYAEKYGYTGCNQISEATMLEVSTETSTFNAEWIEESTIKDLLDTPLGTDITSKIYKVKAIINKADSGSYVNYYIDDLDNKTGTYSYTKANGSDFTWLDEYDAKLVEMYVTILNAKSTSTGCIYRISPISVIGEYSFDLTNACDFAFNYLVKDLFLDSYSSDPAISLITSYSSEILGISDLTISYESNNTDIIYIETETGETVLHTKGEGEAKLTVTIKLGDNEKSFDVTIKTTKIIEVESINVKAAIDSEDEIEVTVKGVVGPSLVNQKGFYLIDETGVIAIITTEETLALLSIGDEVILTGNRSHKNPTDTLPGQSCLLDTVLVENHYGNHDYSTSSFITDKTIEDVATYSVDLDYTAQVYVLTITISKTEGSYPVYLLNSADKETSISLYSSSTSQYAFLEDYVDKEVTIEVALCNWNKKSSYKACVLSVTYEGTKVVNSLNFN